MENLKKPDVPANASRRQTKIAILNAKKSAAWGIWFIAIPVFFLACVTIKYLFHWTWGVSDNLIEWMANMDQHSATAWITPVLFVLLPAICALANLLAILHFMYDRTAKELLVHRQIKVVEHRPCSCQRLYYRHYSSVRINGNLRRKCD